MKLRKACRSKLDLDEHFTYPTRAKYSTSDQNDTTEKKGQTGLRAPRMPPTGQDIMASGAHILNPTCFPNSDVFFEFVAKPWMSVSLHYYKQKNLVLTTKDVYLSSHNRLLFWPQVDGRSSPWLETSECPLDNPPGIIKNHKWNLELMQLYDDNAIKLYDSDLSHDSMRRFNKTRRQKTETFFFLARFPAIFKWRRCLVHLWTTGYELVNNYLFTVFLWTYFPFRSS